MIAMARFFLLALVAPFFSLYSVAYDYDLAVVGPLCFADGIGRQSIGVIDCLADQLRVKFIPSRFGSSVNLQDLPPRVKESIMRQTTGTIGVALLEDLITCGTAKAYRRMPKCHIKLAYTMVESQEVPNAWVSILNSEFDAALVPDPFLLKVYTDAGVRIPIFVLPLGLYINEFLLLPQKAKKRPFVFGFSGTFIKRKNHLGLLEAFAQAFGNNPDVQLRLHGRADYGTYQTIKDRIAQLGLKNVELLNTVFSWHEYAEFLTSLDCYVSLSYGEGYSLTPREVLALATPCILSNNTAHTTIIATGCVKGVDDQADAAHALQEVMDHYDVWKQKALRGRDWVAGFTYDNLRALYLSIVRPELVVMGDCNRIQPGCLVTTSARLFEKYRQLIESMPL